MKKFLAISTILSLITLAFVGRAQFSPSTKLKMAEAAIANYYVDTVNESELVENAIRGMLEELDPHSSYSTAEETRELNEPLQGNFSGVGVTYNINKDTIYIISTVSGGPSERVGIRPGDRIIAINDTNVAGIKVKTRDVQKRLRGPKDTKVNVTVLRNSGATKDTLHFTITRDNIPIFSVDAAYMADPTTGYIRISRFAAETPQEVRSAVNDLKKQGMQNLILDLTDNGGGYLNAATEMLGEFLKPGAVAVFTEGEHSPLQEIHSFPKKFVPIFPDGRVVVMVNQYTASASEITSGAIQDYDRGVIVGRRTFGKGLVQRPIPFPDGSMMRLTVAHYYTPSGRDIQKPYKKGNSKDYGNDILDRYNNGELMHGDSIKYIDSLKVTTINNGRTIYGGGGITPDKFVALDTTQFTKYYRDLMAKGAFNTVAVNYVDNNRKNIKKIYKTDTEFVKNFEVNNELLEQLYKQGEKEGVNFNEEQARISRPLFCMILKAIIGRDTYENATYYKVYNTYDPIFQTAIDIINSDEYDRLLQPKK